MKKFLTFTDTQKCCKTLLNIIQLSLDQQMHPALMVRHLPTIKYDKQCFNASFSHKIYHIKVVCELDTNSYLINSAYPSHLTTISFI